MAILGDYVNGNHRTILYDDGTRFRETGSYVDGKWVADDADHFTFDFPESFDLKVTDRCDGCCPFCHENSTIVGKHGDLSKMTHIVETIQPGTEIAVGGGDLFTCPGIDDFLALLKRRGIVANITVNQRHLERYAGKLWYLVQEKLVHGIGVSLTNSSRTEDLDIIDGLGPNVVIHVIAGIFEDKDISFVRGRKVLILGYKILRRGISYIDSSRKYAELVHNMDMLRNLWQHDLAKECKAVAYDNLAIEQLYPKEELNIPDTKYAHLYQGNDTECFDADGNMTCSTMFIDLPNMQVARMSTAPMETRQPFTGNESIEELLKLTTKGWTK
jgi:organic radical activating enzyme